MYVLAQGCPSFNIQFKEYISLLVHTFQLVTEHFPRICKTPSYVFTNSIHVVTETERTVNPFG